MKELVEEIYKMQNQLTEIDWRKAAGGVALAGALVLNQPEVALAKTQPPVTQVEKENKNIVAKVIAGEAAGEGYDGMYAVACVIQNRGKDPIKIVTSPYQFSAIKDNELMDRNYKQVKKVVDKLSNQIGNLTDTTGGATNYVTNSHYASHKNRGWLSRLKVTKVIGNHTFLKEE